MKSSVQQNPLVSVIIPAFGREELLMRAIESVLGQTEQGFELIVVDDGTPQGLSAVQRRVEGAKQHFLRIDHGGVSAARNKGVEISSGSWIAFLDSDDEWLPEKLARQCAFHRESPELISQTDEIWIRHDRRVNKRKFHQLADGDGFLLSLSRCAISPSSVMMRRDVFEEAGGFDEFLTVCEDYELWIRLTASHRIGFIAEPLIRKYGGHADQLSKSRPALDCYRLYGLAKPGIRGELCPEKQQALLDAAGEKLEILLVGARKRTLPHVARLEELRGMGKEARAAGVSGSSEIIEQFFVQTYEFAREQCLQYEKEFEASSSMESRQ